MKMVTPEWHKNNGSALQALICGKDPDDFIRKGNIEPCSITQAAEICKVTTYVIRRYTFGRFPEIYQKLGIEAMPPLDAYTQTFEMTEVKKWARHLEKIRAKAEAIAPQKPKMTQAEAKKRGWVTMGDLARVSRIKAATLASWFKTGLPAKYGITEEFPTPAYKCDNVCYYDGSTLEWVKRLGNQVAAVRSKEEDELRKKASIVPKTDPLHIRRTAVAKMLNITPPVLSLWQLHGIPKKLTALGCPELPKVSHTRQKADYYRAEDVAPWVLAYKKAVQALKEKREESRKANIAKKNAKRKENVPRLRIPDVSDFGFEVVCLVDAARLLKIHAVTLTRYLKRGFSKPMIAAGIPDFPEIVCRRGAYKFFKKSEVEAWGKAYHSIFPQAGRRK